MRKLLNIISLIGLVLTFIIGCNKGADPIQDYSGVKAVPMHNTPFRDQYFLLSPFTIQMIDGSFVANFTAGQKGQVLFKISADSRIKNYSVTSTNIPNGATLKPTKEPGIYSLSWTPERNVIPQGQNATNLKFTLRAVVRESSEPRLVGVAGAAPVDFQLIVLRNVGQPIIKDLKGLVSDEGSITKLEADTITNLQLLVDDPSSTPENAPKLHMDPCMTGQNTENSQTNGQQFLSWDGVTSPSAGKFIYQIKLDLKNQNIPLSKDPEGAEICFKLSVQNEGNASSGEIVRVVKAMYKPKRPVIALGTNDRDISVRAGHVVSVNFNIDAGREYGVLSVNENSAALPSDSENPAKLECKPVKENNKENLNKLECSFNWMIPDNITAKTYDLKIEATHVVARNGKNMESTEIKIVHLRAVKIDAVSAKKTTPAINKQSATQQGVPK